MSARPGFPLYDLATVHRAPDGAYIVVLRRPGAITDAAARAWRDARAAETEARERVEEAAQRVATAKDAVDRMQAESALREAKADLVATSAIVPLREREHASVAPLAARLRARLADLERAAAERDVHAALEQAKATLEQAQRAFLSEVRTVQQELAEAKAAADRAGLKALSEQCVLTNPLTLVDVTLASVEALTVGRVQFDYTTRARITFRRWWRGSTPGAAAEMSYTSALDLWKQGIIERPVPIAKETW